VRQHHSTADGIRYIETPGRLAEVRSDVTVPFLQAAGISGSLGLAVGVLALLWVGPGRGLAGGELLAWSAKLAATATVIALLVTVVAFTLQHRRVILSIVEEQLGRDLDGDGVIGQPEPPMVRAEVHDRDKKQTTIADLPTSKSELRRVAIAVLRNGRAFSRPALAGVISQRTYNRLAKAMVRRGLARDLPGKRRELTPAGRAILRHILEE